MPFSGVVNLQPSSESISAVSERTAGSRRLGKLPVFLPQGLIQYKDQPNATLAELHRGILGCHRHIIIAQPMHVLRIWLRELAICIVLCDAERFHRPIGSSAL